MELEIKHLAPYLPYNLQVEVLDYKSDYVGKQYDKVIGLHQWDSNGQFWSVLTIGGAKPDVKRVKPILRPLSDLTEEDHKEIFFDHDVEQEYDGISLFLNGAVKINILEFPLQFINKLLEKHYDINNLIGQGLAIDINTLAENK
tara:strand:+ start:243 stop:674 length:432 start_codon:yes stop_codon:yes gene_type:complete